MHKILLAVLLLSGCTFAASQSIDHPEEWMNTTRAMYDVPFARNLVSFECAVRFDWKEHFIDSVGSLPPDFEQAIDRLQMIDHTVSFDLSRGAVVSPPPKASAPADRAYSLELPFEAMLTSSLDGWLTVASISVPGPGSGRFEVKSEGQGFRIEKTGSNPDVQATLLLRADRRITAVTRGLPHPMRVDTEFKSGPNGYLLQSVKMTTSAPKAGEAETRFEYETIDGFQLPTTITATGAGATGKSTWKYSLTDCKTVIGLAPKAASPAKP